MKDALAVVPGSEIRRAHVRQGAVEVEEKVAGIKDVDGAKVEIVFDPPWTKEMMSEEALLELGFM